MIKEEIIEGLEKVRSFLGAMPFDAEGSEAISEAIKLINKKICASCGDPQNGGYQDLNAD
jgi:hypothetical protein